MDNRNIKNIKKQHFHAQSGRIALVFRLFWQMQNKGNKETTFSCSIWTYLILPLNSNAWVAISDSKNRKCLYFRIENSRVLYPSMVHRKSGVAQGSPNIDLRCICTSCMRIRMWIFCTKIPTNLCPIRFSLPIYPDVCVLILVALITNLGGKDLLPPLVISQLSAGFHYTSDVTVP